MTTPGYNYHRLKGRYDKPPCSLDKPCMACRLRTHAACRAPRGTCYILNFGDDKWTEGALVRHAAGWVMT